MPFVLLHSYAVGPTSTRLVFYLSNIIKFCGLPIRVPCGLVGWQGWCLWGKCSEGHGGSQTSCVPAEGGLIGYGIEEINLSVSLATGHEYVRSSFNPSAAGLEGLEWDSAELFKVSQMSR